jgi:hypothetical protein
MGMTELDFRPTDVRKKALKIIADMLPASAKAPVLLRGVLPNFNSCGYRLICRQQWQQNKSTSLLWALVCLTHLQRSVC